MVEPAPMVITAAAILTPVLDALRLWVIVSTSTRWVRRESICIAIIKLYGQVPGIVVNMVPLFYRCLKWIARMIHSYQRIMLISWRTTKLRRNGLRWLTGCIVL